MTVAFKPRLVIMKLFRVEWCEIWFGYLEFRIYSSIVKTFFFGPNVAIRLFKQDKYVVKFIDDLI